MRLRETVCDNAAPSLFFLSFGGGLVEEFFFQSYLQGLPLLWLAAVSFAFWMGQDVYHSHGRLRVLYRRLRSFGKFQNFITRYEYFSLGNDHGGEQQFVAIYMPFVFSKERSLAVIRIKATIRSYVANNLRMCNPSDYEWMDTSFSDIHHVPDGRIEMPIAFISYQIRESWCLWG
ncbi:MAG: hypothetical protein ACHBNF_08500 [Chromatiales bacterium]